MSQSAVEQIIGRLVMDKEFRTKMQSNRDAALAEFDLTAEERANLATMDLNEFNASLTGLDERVSKDGIYTTRPN